MNSLCTFKNTSKPLELFNTWLQEATTHPDIKQANSMVLSNVYRDKISNAEHVSSRVVLLKEVQKKTEQLIFYTNYNSIKKTQLTYYPAALNFYWPNLNKQIRLEGNITKVSRIKSVAYWKIRSRESQISQYVSQQSTVLKDVLTLKKKWDQINKQFDTQEIPCPQHWGGYAFSPYLIEFWVEQPYRLHNRLQFTKKDSHKQNWTTEFLSP